MILASNLYLNICFHFGCMCCLFSLDNKQPVTVKHLKGYSESTNIGLDVEIANFGILNECIYMMVLKPVARGRCNSART